MFGNIDLLVVLKISVKLEKIFTLNRERKLKNNYKTQPEVYMYDI